MLTAKILTAVSLFRRGPSLCITMHVSVVLLRLSRCSFLFAAGWITWIQPSTQQRLLLFLKCCFTSTETVGLLGPWAQDSHLDFHTDLELCLCAIETFTVHTGVWPSESVKPIARTSQPRLQSSNTSTRIAISLQALLKLQSWHPRAPIHLSCLVPPGRH